MLPKISHPKSEVIIPSTQTKIFLRPMLVKEEKILLMAKEANDDKHIFDALRQVVNNCILDKIDVNKLTLFDIEFLFLKLRAISIDNVVNIAFEDKEDNQEYKFDINLNEITVKFPEKLNNIIIVDENTKLVLKFLESRIYTDNEFLDLKEEDKINDYVIMYSIDKIIHNEKELNIKSYKKEELLEFIGNLPIKCHNEIKEYIMNTPKLNYELEYINSKGTERKVVLSDMTDFFTFA